MKKICAVLAVVGVVLCGAVMATPIEVGSGANSANVTINWKDGYTAEFTVRFDGAPNGMDVLHVIDTALIDFTLTTGYGGGYVDGLAYNNHSNDGFVSPDDWWHYWNKDSGQVAWAESGGGASDRVVANGDSDGWVYGNAGAPVPEPATLVMLGLGGLLLRRKK
jgi:hypothetical protein